ncbi:MAG: ComEC/Rec2 family competence protein [Candidatus Gracilibacteria bacterium]|nr:ComEC/Rec2 family competence protein [Candidatus Gracilibacteria bacterium]
MLSIIVGFVFGVILSQINLNEIVDKQNFIVKYIDNSRHELQFKITDTYKIDKYNTQYKAILDKVDNIDIDKEILSIITVQNNFDIEKGYIIISSAYLNKIDNFEGFAYKDYMLSKNIFFTSYLNYIEVVDKKELSKLDSSLINLREKFLGVIHKLYPENEALFLGGILLGAREGLPNDLKTNFNNSGLTHFIAVSGFNITILVVFFSFLFKYFPLVLRVVLITGVIIGFTMLVGDTAPVVRASIMGLIGYYIMVSGRKGNTWTIVLLTAFIMVLFSPYSLNYDISLHLSFLAVLGIIFTGDFFKKIFGFLPETLAIKEAFVLTMSAMSFSLPIMIFNFGQISLISPISNIAMAWTIPFAMLFGFISILVYFISPVLGFIVGYIDFIFLRYDMIIVDFFGNLDWAILKIDAGVYKNYFMLLYFVTLCFIILYFSGDTKKQAA